MSCVIAFFFSGRLSLITRMASLSVTVTCAVMGFGFRQSAMAGMIEISYIICMRTQTGAVKGRADSAGVKNAVDRHTSSDRNFGKAARKPRLLYGRVGHAAGQED